MMATHLLGFNENKTAIVYTAGFKGAAARIRNSGEYIFSQLAHTSSDTIDRFTCWWEARSSEDILPFFWGDLDYSGLGILSGLRSTFTNITAWRPAYEVMIRHLQDGNAHPASSGSKGAQTDPVTTGCRYADEVILPAIREKDLFVDQEVVGFSDLYEYFATE